jgi:C-terminal processing protease CtpA/Prc
MNDEALTSNRHRAARSPIGDLRTWAIRISLGIWVLGYSVLCAPAPIHAADKAPTRKIEKLYKKLGADKARDRKKAQTELSALSTNHWEAIEQRGLTILATTDDPEVTIRVEAILKTGVDALVFRLNRGFIGVALLDDNLTGDNPGMTIVSVIAGTAAEENGFEAGQRILKINDKPIGPGFGVAGFTSYVKQQGSGAKVELTLSHNGVKKIISLTLGERPATNTDPPLDKQKETFFKEWLETSLEETRQKIGE